MASGTQNLTSDKARVLSTQPGTDKFWRGDNSWSNILGGPLYINDSTDVGLDQNGALIIGLKSGLNIGIDDNEIMARNNGTAGTLYIQNEGGSVIIGANTTINANMTHNGIDYFANGTTYYINNSGTANLNALTVNSTTLHKDTVNITYDKRIIFYGKNNDTSPCAQMGYMNAISGTAVHSISTGGSYQNSGAFYIWSNGCDAGNDNGGIAIDNEGVTVFGAGDPGSNFTGVFRVINEDSIGTGPIFTVKKAGAVYFGNGQGYYISNDGSSYTGNAATASQLYVTGSAGTLYLTGVSEYATKNQTQYIYSPNYINSGNYYGYGMLMPTSVQSYSTSQPMGICYGRVQCYGTLNINADTDGSQSEYCIITSGRGCSSSTSDGLWVGYNSAGFSPGTFSVPNGLICNHGVNFMVGGNEVNFIPDGYNNTFWFNYTTFNRNNSGTVSQYIFGNGHAGSLATISDGQFSGNAASATYASSAGDADTVDDWHRNDIRQNCLSFTRNINSANPTNLNNLNNGMAYNYGSGGYWQHAPSSPTYGSCIALTSGGEAALGGQFYWDINHDSSSSTRSLWFRAANNKGWQDDWKHIVWDDASPSFTGITITGNGRISGNGNALYLGNSGNQSWVYVQDMASQLGTGYWAIHQGGAAEFAGAVTLSNKLTVSSHIHTNGRIYHDSGSMVLHCSAGYHLAIQTDGNLVLYNSNDTSRWSTGTASSYLVKNNIKSIDNSDIDKFMKINPVSFTYKPELKYEDNRTKYGVIAEELMQLYPNLVFIPPEYDPKKFDLNKGMEQPRIIVYYEQFIPLLIKIVQNQQREIEELKNQLIKNSSH